MRNLSITDYPVPMAGRRVAAAPSERRSALTILAVGTLVSVASLLGSVWVVRAGVVVAIAMAFAAVTAAWRQLELERAAHRTEIREQVAVRVAQAERHHAEQVAMIDRFTARSENLKGIVAQLRRQLALATAELSSMRGNAVWLRAEVAERQAHIDELVARIAMLESEHSEKLVLMPRRGAAVDVQPSTRDIWEADEHPTMVDLAKLQLDGIPELRRHA